LHFSLIEGKLLSFKDNKVSFLDFDLKIYNQQKQKLREAKKILSFKKLQNQLSSRLFQMRTKFNSMVLKVIEATRLKKLKFFLKGKKDKKSILAFSEKISGFDALEISTAQKQNIVNNVSFKE
jgi:hypothetical protein